MKSLTMINKASAVLLGLVLFALPAWAQINLLHEFAGGASDGAYPRGDLILSGNTLYGMTWIGGDWNNGTIFKMGINGTGFSLLHEFAGGTADGARPNGSLLLSGTTLYGMTWHGGDNDMGTIFKIETDGTGYSILHEFEGSTYDGKNPNGSLIIAGSTLYGMTIEGGSINMGTIFKMDTDGNNFALLHDFSGGVDDGSQPFGSLLSSGSTLYGMTIAGGDNETGTIFKIDRNGSGFAILHEFSGYMSNRANPEGSLIILDSTLYGMIKYGGDNDRGAIFKIDIDGSGFAILHSFAGGTEDGAYPKGSLLLSESTLYGMTQPDDVYSNIGTIFKLEISGSNFTLLHSFADGAADGAWPLGSLIISNSVLYGMTSGGGDNKMGVVFSLPLNPILVSGTVTCDELPLAEVVMDGLPGNPVTNGSGNYSAWVESGWSGTVTPTHQYYDFTPSSTSYASIDSDQVTDYTATLIQPLVVTAPAGASLWEKGLVHTITWLKQGEQGAYVKIGLFKGTGTLVGWLTKNTANDGAWDWLVPKDLATGSKYFIKVKTVDGLLFDDSEYFSIIVPNITITAPGAGAVWTRNTTRTITWDRVGAQHASVKIQLYKGTVKVLNITTDTANSGSYDWAIPALPAGTNYSIRIITLDGKVKGKSKKFTIAKS